ncbi:hypothetical protein [Paraflavitalea speifideaquila]|uniref:hypothetical protein n=1 Tax=Paraflavitalea speifideaquila TaxID=3076558 RepID=UPI0028ED6C59|nr:hypothetical protein [Paraflavitalea speifideiaquila]
MFNAYDNKGNILQQQKANDINIAYIWDYQSNYPIAEITGAGINQIAYSSFEADDNGYWFLNQPGMINTSEGFTGKRSYAINGVLARYNLDPALTYTVSIWTKNGIPNYNGFNGATQVIADNNNWTVGAIVNGWTYREKKLTGVTTINIGGGGGLVDEVRLYPSNARMTTYTYHPLIGHSSACNANNQVSYYEYDSFNRLLRVRDENKNILKAYDYQLQAPNNPDALWTATGNTRCKTCPANSIYLAGIRQQEEKDLNPQSSSYNTLRWIDIGPDGSCAALADWQNTTTPVRCQTIAIENTGYQEREQRDMNPCSPTYNQIKWTLLSQNCVACPRSAVWQSTGNYRCIKDASNNNTGEQEREERDIVVCSPTYNQLRWVNSGLSTACPAATCNSSIVTSRIKNVSMGFANRALKHTQAATIIHLRECMSVFTIMYSLITPCRKTIPNTIMSLVPFNHLIMKSVINNQPIQLKYSC